MLIIEIVGLFVGFSDDSFTVRADPRELPRKVQIKTTKKTNKRQYRIWGEGKFYNFMLGSRVTRFWNINIV